MGTFDSISLPLEQQVTAALLRLGTAMRSGARRGAERANLTPAQGEILLLLEARREGLRLGEIAEHTAVTPASASEALAALQRKKLIQKTVDPADRRAISVQLTPAGKSLAQDVSHWPDFLVGAIETLTPDEQSALYGVLLKMIRSLQQQGEIPINRMCTTCKHFRPNQYPGSPEPHHCGLVDAPFGIRHLRLDCPDHSPATVNPIVRSLP